MESDSDYLQLGSNVHANTISQQQSGFLALPCEGLIHFIQTCSHALKNIIPPMTYIISEDLFQHLY